MIYKTMDSNCLYNLGKQWDCNFLNVDLKKRPILVRFFRLFMLSCILHKFPYLFLVGGLSFECRNLSFECYLYLYHNAYLMVLLSITFFFNMDPVQCTVLTVECLVLEGSMTYSYSTFPLSNLNFKNQYQNLYTKMELSFD